MCMGFRKWDHDYRKYYEQCRKFCGLGYCHQCKDGEEHHQHEDGVEHTSTTEHDDRTKAVMNDILYITGDSIVVVSPSLFLKTFREKEYEVLYMDEPTDERAWQQLKGFNGKMLSR